MDFLKKVLPRGSERYLRGIDFPIRKQELVSRLQRNGAPGPAVDQVRKRLPDGEYRSVQEILKGLMQ